MAGILVDKTCFYAEQGGQIYDEGFITKDGVGVVNGGVVITVPGTTPVFHVLIACSVL